MLGYREDVNIFGRSLDKAKGGQGRSSYYHEFLPITERSQLLLQGTKD